MFISEGAEADYYGFKTTDWDFIGQSNRRSVSVLTKYINEPLKVLYQKLLSEYGALAKTNPIARFNLERLYLTCSSININTGKVIPVYK